MACRLRAADMLELDYPRALGFLKYALQNRDRIDLDVKRCYCDYTGDRERLLLRFRYPLCINLPEEKPLRALEGLPAKIPGPYSILLLQAGNAALATVENGRITHHNVISKYVTRKKQGKAQLNYLNTKGKSRAGSRIRLKNMALFIDEVLDWFDTHLGNRHQTLLYSCPPPLWGLLFSGKRQPPFTKKDSRLRKIPLDINIPRFAEVKRARHEIEQGRLEWSDPLPDAVREEITRLWEGGRDTPD